MPDLSDYSTTLPTAKRRDRRGAVFAVLLHAALLLLAVRGARYASETAAPESSFLENGARRGGGGGGGSMPVYIGRVPTQTAPPETPPVPVVRPVQPPEPVPPPPLREAVVPEVAAPAPQMASTSAGVGEAGAGEGGGRGEGRGTGTGSGTGPGSGTGAGGGSGDGGPVSAPVWRSGALPFDSPPKSLRGRTVRVTFFVRADGRVEKLETDPPLDDRDYAVRFDETLRDFRFLPARTMAGVAVAAKTVLTFELPSR